MENSVRGHFSIEGRPRYPHLKLTRERFPRLLATRILRDDGDEYFGAFLTRTAVRILIDQMNRSFRLRSCMIDIDGSFDVPCTQYFAKRCVAPCVRSLCSEGEYAEIVRAARLFLSNDREAFSAAAAAAIEKAANGLLFEKAAFWRDILDAAAMMWENPRRQVWLDDTVDTYIAEEGSDGLYIFVITQRRTHVLGALVYRFEERGPTEEAIGSVILQMYVHHLPREIRVPAGMAGRADLIKELQQRFSRRVKIASVGDLASRRTTARATERLKAAEGLNRLADILSGDEVEDLRKMIGLAAPPQRIEAFDAASISATGFAAGMAVWEDGKLRPAEYRQAYPQSSSDLEALKTAIADRFRDADGKRPEIVLVDGGKTHLAAAKAAIEPLEGAKPTLIAATKPRGRHSHVSHFLVEDGRRVDFDQSDRGHLLLQRLRDEAHDTANQAHRIKREMLHHFERIGAKPRIVPISLVDLEGEAADLRPILTR